MDNNQDLLAKLQQNKGTLVQLMNSPDGQRLIQLLANQSGGTNLKQAANAAAQGNTSHISSMISQLMNNPEGAALIERINRSITK